MENKQDNYIKINFKTKEIIENRLKPVSDDLLVDVAKKMCHYINYVNRKEIEDFTRIAVGDFEVKDTYIKYELMNICNHKDWYTINSNEIIFSSNAPKQKVTNYNKLQKILKIKDEKIKERELELLSKKIRIAFDKEKIE